MLLWVLVGADVSLCHLARAPWGPKQNSDEGPSYLTCELWPLQHRNTKVLQLQSSLLWNSVLHLMKLGVSQTKGAGGVTKQRLLNKIFYMEC